MCRRKRVLTAGSLLATGLLVVVFWLWFGPVGTGEYRHSPDGRFTAHASNMSTGTWTGGRDRYVEVQVIETATGREVWRAVRRPAIGTAVPDYGDRAERFVRWAADSTSVTVPVGGGRELVLAVP